MAAAAGSAAVKGTQPAKPLLPAAPPEIGSREMFALIRELVRPYTGWLVIVLIAMRAGSGFPGTAKYGANPGHQLPRIERLG